MYNNNNYNYNYNYNEVIGDANQIIRFKLCTLNGYICNCGKLSINSKVLIRYTIKMR